MTWLLVQYFCISAIREELLGSLINYKEGERRRKCDCFSHQGKCIAYRDYFLENARVRFLFAS